MKNYKITFLLIALALATTMCFGQVADPSHPMIQFPDGSLMSPTNPMPTTTNIGTVTVDAFPVYKDGAGDPATAQLDTNDNVKVNIASENIDLIDSINAVEDANTETSNEVYNLKNVTLSPATMNVTKMSLLANTSTQIQDLYPNEPYNQKFVEIKAEDDNSVFWISFGTAAVIRGNARPCKGGVYVELRNQDLYVISPTNLDIYVTRGATKIPPK